MSLTEPGLEAPAPAHPPDAANGTLAADLPPPDAYTPPNLPAEAISRYSRQLLLPSFGPSRQVALSSGRALIIGCGGLGCPAALYLGAAGVGHLALADRPGDVVEVTNLHRQVGHTTGRVGRDKAASLAAAVTAINPLVAVTVVDGGAFVGGHRPGGATAEALVASFDVVLDCTDNVAARYLINDACVLGGVPLVAGAAVGTDGQLTVYNWEDPAVASAAATAVAAGAAAAATADTKGGPPLAAGDAADKAAPPPRKSNRVCLRCVFPSPPPPSCVGSCDTAGVLGPVPGVIGVLQALEAIKVLSSRRPPPVGGARAPADGASCSVVPFSPSGGPPHLPPEWRLAAPAFARTYFTPAGTAKTLLVDVRPVAQYALCAVPGSVSVPLGGFEAALPSLAAQLTKGGGTRQLVVVCRRGNSSRVAVAAARGAGVAAVDVVGGLSAWPGFPAY